MALEMVFLGQSVPVKPDVTLKGDIAKDTAALTAAGFVAGRCVTLKSGGKATLTDGLTQIPYAALMNGANDYAVAIGVSGSRQLSAARSMSMFNVTSDCYVSGETYTPGLPLYLSTGANAGKWSVTVPASGPKFVAGTITHEPSAAEPWLGIAQLF